MDLISHFPIIENAIRQIREQSNPELASTTSYLETLYDRLQATTERELKEEPKTDALIASTQMVFLIVNVFCDYYRTLKQFRALNDDEKALGSNLNELLQVSMAGLLKAQEKTEGEIQKEKFKGEAGHGSN
jgi:hypothetical protein